MTAAPQTIPLNGIDRSYLISETEQEDGVYFPMSIVMVIKLRSPFLPAELVAALQALVKQYPNLRLGYSLDVSKRHWVRIAPDHLADHFAACIQEIPQIQSIEDTIATLVAVNNTSLTQPLNLFVAGDFLILRMHHSFGDGKFLFLITQYLLAELQQQPVDQLPLSDQWWMPLWRVIWQDVGQGLEVMWRFVKSSLLYYQEYQRDTSANPDHPARYPITTGSPMQVCFKAIDPDCLTLLREMRGDFSLNTLLQVIIEERLNQLGWITRPTTYTIPVDLRRYLKDRDVYHPGNLAAQVRITLEAEMPVMQRCVVLQTRIQEQLQQKMPLVSIPGEWLLALGGNQTYQSVNRDWLLKSTHHDPRFFILTNLGNVDGAFRPVDALLSDQFDPQLVVPLMGGPPLVCSFNEHRNRGNLAITFDPQVLSRSDIEAILEAFDRSSLKSLAGQ